jgi:hypothetical protein
VATLALQVVLQVMLVLAAEACSCVAGVRMGILPLQAVMLSSPVAPRRQAREEESKSPAAKVMRGHPATST